MTTTEAHLTDCGLPGILRVPYGLHACHFYRGREQLLEALVPYFVAGLRNDERCLWVTAPPLPARDALLALSKAWRNADDAIASGALRILDFDRWYAEGAALKGSDVQKLWLEEERRALSDGYSGLRITGNTSFLHHGHDGDWAKFMEYEQGLSANLHGRRIVALCSYSLKDCSAAQIAEVMHSHDCRFERPDWSWQVTSTLTP